MGRRLGQDAAAPEQLRRLAQRQTHDPGVAAGEMLAEHRGGTLSAIPASLVDRFAARDMVADFLLVARAKRQLPDRQCQLDAAVEADGDRVRTRRVLLGRLCRIACAAAAATSLAIGSPQPLERLLLRAASWRKAPRMAARAMMAAGFSWRTTPATRRSARASDAASVRRRGCRGTAPPRTTIGR